MHVFNLCRLLSYTRWKCAYCGYSSDARCDRFGKIDTQDIIAKLNGEWKYYDGRRKDEVTSEDAYAFVSIPENKKTTQNKQFYRYGTYVLEVSGLKANTAYGIYSGSQVTALIYMQTIIWCFKWCDVRTSYDAHPTVEAKSRHNL